MLKCKHFVKRHLFTIMFLVSVSIVIGGIILIAFTELWILGFGALVWILPMGAGLRGALEFEW